MLIIDEMHGKDLLTSTHADSALLKVNWSKQLPHSGPVDPLRQRRRSALHQVALCESTDQQPPPLLPPTLLLLLLLLLVILLVILLEVLNRRVLVADSP